MNKIYNKIIVLIVRVKLLFHPLFRLSINKIPNRFGNNISDEIIRQLYYIILYEKLKSIIKISKFIIIDYNVLSKLTRIELLSYITNKINMIIKRYESNIYTKFITLTNNVIGRKYYDIIYTQSFKPYHNQNITFIQNVIWIFYNDYVKLYQKLYMLFDIFTLSYKIASVELYENLYNYKHQEIIQKHKINN